MKKIVIFISLFCILPCVFPVSKSTIRFNGSQENEIGFARSINFNDVNNKFGEIRWGINSLTNFRVKSNIGEYITFNLALNISLLSGLYSDTYKMLYLSETFSKTITLANPDSIYETYYGIPFYYKSTYLGAFELERVTMKVGVIFFDVEMGLMRIAHGYGYAFSPTDFFNPKNPFNQNSRPEGKLAVQTTFYPQDMWKIQLFTVAPDNPLESRGWGIKTGAATQYNINKFNFEFLYTLIMPDIEYEKEPENLGLSTTVNNDFTHIAGFSMKADIEVGFFIDLLYRFEQRWIKTWNYYDRKFNGYDGLEAAIGIDYTLPGGKVYLLTEYLFYGPGGLDWAESLNDLYSGNDKWGEYSMISRSQFIDTKKNIKNFLRHDYLFNMVQFKINDYLSINTSLMAGLDDISGVAAVALSIEPVQALVIDIRFSNYLDRNMFASGLPAGEMGPANVGTYNGITINTKIKF